MIITFIVIATILALGLFLQLYPICSVPLKLLLKFIKRRNDYVGHDFSKLIKTINQLSSKAFYIFSGLFIVTLFATISITVSLYGLKPFIDNLLLNGVMENKEVAWDVFHRVTSEPVVSAFVFMNLSLIFFVFGGCFKLIKTISSRNLNY